MSTAATAPVSTTTSEQLVTAATAAAAVLPSPTPLVLGPTDGSLAPEVSGQTGEQTGLAGTAVVVSFTGGTSGTVTVLVDAALAEALASAEGGPLPLADAVAPALQAAVTALGPAVPAAPEAVDAASAVATATAAGGLWAPLVGGEGGDVVAWLGLTVAASTSSSGGSASPTMATPLAAALPAQRTGSGINMLRDVEMVLTVELGRTRMSVRELLALTPGSVIELDRAAGAPADLMVNGRLLARGEVVVVDEDYGLRITEIVEPGAEG